MAFSGDEEEGVDGLLPAATESIAKSAAGQAGVAAVIGVVIAAHRQEQER